MNSFKLITVLSTVVSAFMTQPAGTAPVASPPHQGFARPARFSSAGKLYKRGTVRSGSGDLTFYSPEGAPTTCGGTYTSSDMIAAMVSVALWSSKEYR
jgi:hypothetical protein